VSVQVTAVKEHSLDVAARGTTARAVLLRPILLFLLGFLVLCAFFDGLQRAFPYLATGSEVVFQAKLRDEARGAVFPIKTSGTKVIVFGNSSILAGLVSKHFDELARADGLETYTYNSGFPGHVEFVPQLKAMVDTGNAPDVVLLTKAWQPKRSGGIFKLPFADQELANTIFPFRNLIRDAASFAFTSRERGGLLRFYRKASQNIAQMQSDQGYYFISEQSHYASERLPDDFHMADDKPNVPQFRQADPSSPELAELNSILRAHSIKCFYVPYPARGSALGEAPPTDPAFQQLVESHTPCKVVGPYYYRYPNRDLSDQTHLNHIGSKIYTEDLYRLVKPYLAKGDR
jgi:hypothetical protein